VLAVGEVGEHGVELRLLAERSRMRSLEGTMAAQCFYRSVLERNREPRVDIVRIRKG
jgi:hypothetical protein